MVVEESGVKAVGQLPFPWLLAPWNRLLQCMEQERLPHAILLVGPQGTGLQALATAMGEYLLCSTPIEGHACGRCKACGLLLARSHPDMFAIIAEGNGKSIKIDQIRTIIESTSTTAQQGGRRVILITPAEAMNRNAANALLKGLEEPGDSCVYILVSESPAKVLPTIRSRCRRFDVHLPEKAAALDWLIREGVSDADRLLAEAGGRPLLVKQWLDQKLYDQRDRLMDAVVKVMQGQLSESAAAKLLGGYDPIWVTDQLQNMLLTTVKKKNASDFSGPDNALVRSLETLESRALCLLFDAITRRKQWLLSNANPNVELLMADLLVEFRGEW